MAVPSAGALPRYRVLADTIPGSRVRDVVLVVGGALLTALFAQISIDVPPSPVPITGQTLAVGRWMAEHGADREPLLAFGAFVLGQLIIFAFGLAGLKISVGETWGWTIHNGFSIFIVGGVVKALVGAMVLPSAWGLVRRFEHR
jgi:biotin transport system substrate-specific component